MSKILIVDDEPKMTLMISANLEEAGYKTDTAASGKQAMAKLGDQIYELVITDIKLPPPDGIQILDWISRNRPETLVIMITAFAEVKTAVEALRKGAADYLIKPFSLEELTLLVNRLLSQRKTEHLKELREEDFNRLAYDEFIGKSPAAKKLIDLIGKVAKTDTTVLITGESGSGKELAARMIHNLSSRNKRPFIAVNCAALTETLLESELFGHERGAFTGAVARKPGRFELADKGTIFLDEIGDMSPGLQAKLLRVLEEQKVVRVGGIDNIDIDVRLLAATNKNLKEMIDQGRFRDDLYFRICTFPIPLPALRDRREDIPLLARYFLEKRNFAHAELEDEVIDLLKKYHWPGNIRELKNILDRAIILSEGQPLNVSHIGIDKEDTKTATAISRGGAKSLGEVEKEQILDALKKSGGSKTEAARILGITRRRLYSRMRIHGIKS